MATSNVPISTLDTLLALQLTVAWAGEGRCEPARLGWWQTDLIDAAGGGDLLARMLPRTHAWASLEAVREAARRVDAQARKGMAHPDGVRTLFFLGFELDERLAERLTALKRAGSVPHEALALPVSFSTPFSVDTLAEALRQPGLEGFNYSVVPGGRQLKGTMPMALDAAVRQLAAALIPFQEHYPVPFYRVTS